MIISKENLLKEKDNIDKHKSTLSKKDKFMFELELSLKAMVGYGMSKPIPKELDSISEEIIKELKEYGYDSWITVKEFPDFSYQILSIMI